MGLRFRRSIKLLPGIRLNFGKRGVSTSIGVRGAHVTVGRGQVCETVGLPGIGISYTHIEGVHKTALERPGAAQSRSVPWIKLIAAVALLAWLGWIVAHHGGLS